jgi:hypothetical protein
MTKRQRVEGGSVVDCLGLETEGLSHISNTRGGLGVLLVKEMRKLIHFDGPPSVNIVESEGILTHSRSPSQRWRED